MSVEAMLEEYVATTVPNPVGRGRVVNVGPDAWALVDLWPGGGRVWLKEIRAIEFGKGHGTAALRFVLALADKHEVTVQLQAHRIMTIDRKFGLSTAQLKRWYARHGFRRSGSGSDCWMFREPQPRKGEQDGFKSESQPLPL
jgi:hypothetical protein